MKKAFLRSITFSLVLSLLIGGVSLAHATEPYHTKDIPELNGSLYFDGVELEESFNAIFEDDFVLVPLRKVFDSIGFDVNWKPETGIHELLSEESELVFRTDRLPSSSYSYSVLDDAESKIQFSIAYHLYFQLKSESDKNNPFDGWVHFELDSDMDYSLFRDFYGREATGPEIEKFYPSPTEACLINDRYYMNAPDMKTLLEQVGYTLVLDEGNNTVLITKKTQSS